MHGRKVSNYALTNCDLLFAIGTRFSDRTTFDLKHFAPLAKVIHADIDPAEIGKNVRVDLPIVGDAKKVLHGMLAILHEMKHSGKETPWTQHINEMEKICRCDIEVDSVPISAARVMHELNKNLPKNTIVTTDVGQHQMWAEHFFKVTNARHFISSGGLGTMGFGFPAAIGAKAACPDKPVACITSEGSFTMMMHELATAINQNLPVAIIMLNNNWLGMVKQWQKHFYQNHYIGVDMGKMPDFVKLTEAFGGEGITVTRPSELGEAIKRAIKSDTTFMVDIRTDPEEDMLPMVPPGGRIDRMISSSRCDPIDKAMELFTRVKS
ncbi:acetolactate synthase large subunit, partial [Candidatus Micrarchaeota archaeon]|nr:acetolactate synthase large subunit [Candidatus Micrarchaeota archaeon]